METSSTNAGAVGADTVGPVPVTGAAKSEAAAHLEMQAAGQDAWRLLPIALLAVVWTVFLALSLGGPLLAPPLVAGVLVFLLYPVRHHPWAGRLMQLAVLLAGLWLLGKVQSIVWIAALGLFVAYLLNPAVTALERRQVPRTRAALLLFLPALLLIILALNLLIPAVYREAVTFFGNLPDYTTRFNAWYHERISTLHTESWPVDTTVLIARLQAQAEKVLNGIGNHLLELTKGLGVVLSTAILTPVVAFNLLKDFPAIKGNLIRLVPRRHESEVKDLFNEMDLLIGRWLRGQLMVAGVVGTLTVIGLALLGIPYAVLLGVTAGLLNFVPVVGYWISLILALFVAITSGHGMGGIVGVLGIYFGFQMLEQNFLSPRIIGSATNLHPVAILLALLVFGSLLGFAGALLAIPITLFLRVFYRRYVRRHWRGEELPRRPAEAAPPTTP